MLTTIDLADVAYRRAQEVAKSRGLSLAELLQETCERALTRVEHSNGTSERVVLPLIESKEPGTLDLTGYDFDDLLA